MLMHPKLIKVNCSQTKCFWHYRNIHLTGEFLKQGYRYHKLQKTFTKLKPTRGSQKPVIAHLAYSFQNKVYIKTILNNYGSNITSKFGWGSHLDRLMPDRILKVTPLGNVSSKIRSNGVKFQMRKYNPKNFL